MRKQSVSKKQHLGENPPSQLDRSLRQIIDAVVDEAEQGTPISTLAHAVYERGKFDLDPLFRQWIVGRIGRILRQRRGPDPRQPVLPGYDLVPASIVGRRNRVSILKATYADLRDYRYRLTTRARRQDPKIAQIESLMALLKNKPRGTRVEEIL